MNNGQIDNTSYYLLPCGKFLEDFIYYKKLNFNIGSALKYKYRAGRKDGEGIEKDLAKADHYIAFEAKCRHGEARPELVYAIRQEVNLLIEDAKTWTPES